MADPIAATPPLAPAPALVEDEPGRVAIVDEAGDVSSVPRENAEKAFASGYRPASSAELRGAKDGVGGKIGAALTGAARGASFGMLDPLLIEGRRALDGDAAAEWQRHDLAEEREAHPTASLVGEIAGSLAPLAFGAPPAEAAVMGEGLLARAGARVLANAPRLFGEGAAFGASHQLTEDILGNHELVAGKYIAAGLEGGLVNLVLGGALHAAGGAVVDRLATRGGTAAADGIGERAVGGLKGMAEMQAAKAAMPGAGIGASEMSKLGGTIEEQTLRARQIGRTLLDEGVTTPGATKAIQAERVVERLDRVGSELDGIRKKLSTAAVRPDAERVMTRMRDEVMVPLLERPFSDAEVKSVTPYLEELASTMGTAGEKGTTFEELHTFRRALDDKLQKFYKMPVEARPPAYDELSKVRAILEGEYEAAADKAAAELGEDLATKYRVAKATYSDLATADKWLTKAAGREAQHRAVSLTDTVMMGSGLASGHGVLAVAAPIANKMMRTYGNQTAAYVLDRVTKLEAIQRAALAFDSKLAGSTKAFFGDGPAPSTSARRAAITPAERVALRTAAKNPALLAEHVGDMVAKTGVRDAAPNVAGAIAQNVVRAASFVAQKLPPEPRPIGVTFGQSKPRELGPRAQAEIDRAINALDADKMLDDLAHRRLSREQVEAIKFVNPQLFRAMQKSVRDYGMANDPSMTIQQEMALAIVFDTPVSSYTRGATIRGFQQAFAQGAPPDPASAGGPGKPIGSGHSKAAESLASPTDRAEAKGAL
ncbi:MAG TPA: hypothetical protein VFN70_18155 [Burkholderiales bacterium]|nr:hypothetical protein [Burkholderiales bacterium]